MVTTVVGGGNGHGGAGRPSSLPLFKMDEEAQRGGNDYNLKVNPDAIDWLLSMVGLLHLSLISILGQTRQGKSFLMGLLADHPYLFKVSHANGPCTKGIDMATITGRSSSSSSHVALGYVDAEGGGSEGLAYDVQLLVPLLLVSRVVIFNWLGHPAKDTILNQLHSLAHAAEKIADEEGQRFGTLIILFRDLNDDSNLRSLVLDEEDEGRVAPQDLRTRNATRRQLKAFFQDIVIFALPQPADERTMRQDHIPFHYLHPDFQSGFLQLKSIIEAAAASPLTIQGRPVTGSLLAHVLPGIVDSINARCELFSPLSLFSQAERRVADQAKERAQEVADVVAQGIREQLRAGGPMDAADLDMAVAGLRATSMEVFEEGVKGLLEGSIGDAREALEEGLEGLCGLLEVENDRARASAHADLMVRAREEDREAHANQVNELEGQITTYHDDIERAKEETEEWKKKADQAEQGHGMMIEMMRQQGEMNRSMMASMMEMNRANQQANAEMMGHMMGVLGSVMSSREERSQAAPELVQLLQQTTQNNQALGECLSSIERVAADFTGGSADDGGSYQPCGGSNRRINYL